MVCLVINEEGEDIPKYTTNNSDLFRFLEIYLLYQGFNVDMLKSEDPEEVISIRNGVTKR